jgi:hypothetical protein
MHNIHTGASVHPGPICSDSPASATLAVPHPWPTLCTPAAPSPVQVPTAVKVELIERLADAGLPVVEATSFVSPKWVPQLADAADVLGLITRRPGVRYTVLTPNIKVDRGQQTGALPEVQLPRLLIWGRSSGRLLLSAFWHCRAEYWAAACMCKQTKASISRCAAGKGELVYLSSPFRGQAPCTGLRQEQGPRLSCRVGYVCASQGFENAIKAGAREVAIFTAASEAFNRKNINCSIDESLRRFEDVMAAAKQEEVPVRGYVSCVVGCPYQVRRPGVPRTRHVQHCCYAAAVSQCSRAVLCARVHQPVYRASQFGWGQQSLEAVAHDALWLHRTGGS